MQAPYLAYIVKHEYQDKDAVVCTGFVMPSTSSSIQLDHKWRDGWLSHSKIRWRIHPDLVFQNDNELVALKGIAYGHKVIQIEPANAVVSNLSFIANDKTQQTFNHDYTVSLKQTEIVKLPGYQIYIWQKVYMNLYKYKLLDMPTFANENPKIAYEIASGDIFPICINDGAYPAVCCVKKIVNSATAQVNIAYASSQVHEKLAKGSKAVLKDSFVDNRLQYSVSSYLFDIM